MKNPYMPARIRPMAGLPALFMKNETVIGTMGNTQGVSSAANPQSIASIISAHIEPAPAASFCAGATACTVVSACAGAASAAGSFSGSAVTAAAVSAGVVPAEMAMVISVSSGGMQLVSSQSIHSIRALTEDSGTESFTRCAKRALPEKVPISIPNVVS